MEVRNMARLLFKIWYILYKKYLYIWFNLNHKKYMKRYNNFLKKIGVKIIGEPRYISLNVILDSTDKFSLIELHDNCVVTGKTHILTHDYSIWHAAVGIGKIKKSDKEFKRKGKVVVGENAFVGAGCILLPNVRIGKNAIVGAGSVVTKNVPENTIVAGNPARSISKIDRYVRKYFEGKNDQFIF